MRQGNGPGAQPVGDREAVHGGGGEAGGSSGRGEDAR